MIDIIIVAFSSFLVCKMFSIMHAGMAYMPSYGSDVT